MQWKKTERDTIAHGTAMVSEDGAVVLRTDKGYVFQIEYVDEALAHARHISNLSIRLNLSLAAPWTTDTFPIPQRPG